MQITIHQEYATIPRNNIQDGGVTSARRFSWVVVNKRPEDATRVASRAYNSSRSVLQVSQEGGARGRARLAVALVGVARCNAICKRYRGPNARSDLTRISINTLTPGIVFAAQDLPASLYQTAPLIIFQWAFSQPCSHGNLLALPALLSYLSPALYLRQMVEKFRKLRNGDFV